MFNIIYAMHTGPKDGQEDALLVMDQVVQEADLLSPVTLKISSDAPAIVAVCDGMGGHARGQWASRFVCEQLAVSPVPATPEETEACLRKIQTAMEVDPDGLGRKRPPEGTTVAGLLFHSQGMLAFNAGDSRIYRLPPEGGLVLVSRDHSLLQSLLDKGRLTADEARDYPYRNVVEFGLGYVFSSAWKGGHFSCHTSSFSNPDGAWLLCTDGVYGALEEEDIARLLTCPSVEGVGALAQRLAKEATDNFTFVVLWRTEEEMNESFLMRAMQRVSHHGKHLLNYIKH